MKYTIKHQSIKPFNTFGIDMDCDIVTIDSTEALYSFLEDNNRKFYVLGGGSNVLFTTDFDGIVLKNELKGIEVIEEDDKFISLSIASGESWHEFVVWALDNNYYGIENLSLIPGTVGAAPMQNIGAYGAEIKDVLTHVEFINYNDMSIQQLSVDECKLGYRDSIFKKDLKEKCFITSVGIKLSKIPNINIGYGAINDKLSAWDISNPTPHDISNAIIDIRKSKLPDPENLGNAGSFFKNVIITQETLTSLKSFYPNIPHYPTDTGDIKLPTAWLIDQCGWKGKRIGNVGTHVNHALVLVNYGGATGDEIMALSKDIQQSVWEKFSIEIRPEVNVC